MLKIGCLQKKKQKKVVGGYFQVYDEYYDGATIGYVSSWHDGFETLNNRDDCDCTYWRMLSQDLPEFSKEPK